MGPVAHHVVTCSRMRAVKCENLLDVTLTYHEGIFYAIFLNVIFKWLLGNKS